MKVVMTKMCQDHFSLYVSGSLYIKLTKLLARMYQTLLGWEV